MPLPAVAGALDASGALWFLRRSERGLRMRAHIGLGLLLACFTVASSSRVAATPDPPCVADIKQFCADVPVGGGRIQACLKEHEAQISEACRTQVDALNKEAAMFDASCRWDVGRFCSELTPGHGLIWGCLEKNKAALSPACLNLVNSMEKK